MDSGISVRAVAASGPFCPEPYGGARPADRAEPAGEFEDVLTATVPNDRVPDGRWVDAPDPVVAAAPGAQGSVRAYAGFP
ncbi:hypothetical protein ACFWWM_05520 [Streptomyces sp. NPDC058682]|uniref:hypothetical protein n=1 Tax=unclassified Streptomyces TaxID=2593676 RepID=UPI00224E71B7|nr:hypothetical protein [Streptomyces sp. NBC_01214]MCX4806173.1 hypothetical protein [Streptomyces sp. NBC_01214]